MKNKNFKRMILEICMSFLLITFLIIPLVSFGKVDQIGKNEDNVGINAYLTNSIIINDTNIASYSSSGTGIASDPYIIDNLYINTTDSLAVDFNGVSPGVYYELRDSHIIGNTYGVYIHDITDGEPSIINCTVEGALSIGGANARYLTVDNCTLIFNQGSNFRRGLRFTNNVVKYVGTYSGSVMYITRQDNIVENNIFYGNFSSFRVNRVTNSSIRNNILLKSGFYIYDDDAVDLVNNTFENNIIDGRPYGHFVNRNNEIITGGNYAQIFIANSTNTIIENQNFHDINIGAQIQNCTDITLREIEIEGRDGIGIENSEDILIEDCTLEGFGGGMDILNAFDIVLLNNHLTGYDWGIECSYTDGIEFLNNTILQNGDQGIYIEDSSNIELRFNVVTIDVQTAGSELALSFWGVVNITIYYNVFISLGILSAPPVEENSATNVMWYDEILEVGNHYSNWTGVGTYAIPGTVGSVDLYPFNDIDQDNLGEYDEVVVFLTSPFNADSDFDGLEDGEEIDIYGTDALSADTDSDGMDDFWEVTYGTNPTTDDASEDLDEDDLTNLEEYNLGSLPDNNDTDSDGMPDGWEHLYNLDLFTNDSAEDPDGDNLTNLEEFNIGTMPNNNDTDGDTFLDGEEVIAGTDPLNASSFPIAGGAEYVGLILGLAFGFATIVGAVIFLNTNKGKAFWKGLLTKFKK